MPYNANSTYWLRNNGRLAVVNDVVTIPLSGYFKGGLLRLEGPWAGTVSFTSDPGTGTYAAQSLTALNGTTGSSTTTNGQWIIPAGIVGLKVTFTTATSGQVYVGYDAEFFNEIDLSDAQEIAVRKAAIYSQKLGNFRGETFPKAALQSALVQVSGTIYFTGIPLLAGEVVSNLVCAVNGGGGGTTVTLQKMGIYQYSGASTVWTQRAATADWSASISVGTENVKPLLTAYTVPADDLYMFAVVTVAATGPSILRGHSGLTVVSPNSTNGGYMIAGTLAGQADLVASPTLTASNGASVWMAWT